MSTSNERNWLIRTTQNQILGPVQKAKVVEFIQKGALGLSDEVSSGNGYWFHLREKELVEKYLFGDLPQSYNPISEAKSTLKNKSNPEKTTSINTAPANATQVIKLQDLKLDKASAPKAEDLEYPDITLIKNEVKKEMGDADLARLPSNDDLEFPDMTLLANISAPASAPSISSSGSKPVVKEVMTSQTDDTGILPNMDDLEYPDMDFISDVKKKAEEEIEVKFDVPKIQAGQNSLRLPNKPEKTEPEIHLEILEPAPKTEKVEEKAVKEVMPKLKINAEPTKLLHERKIKPSAAKENNKIPEPPKVAREIAPEFKNRNDSYLFIVLIVLIVLIAAVIFYYYRFILNKPIPV